MHLVFALQRRAQRPLDVRAQVGFARTGKKFWVFWLGVESQQGVPIETQSADGRKTAQSCMRAVPVIAMQPFWQKSNAFPRMAIGSPIGPFAQSGLDETLGFS